MKVDQRRRLKRWIVSAAAFMTVAAGIWISVEVYHASDDIYGYAGACLYGGIWLGTGALLLAGWTRFRSEKRFNEYIDVITVGTIAVFASLQIIAWSAWPFLACSARLSTSPAVVLLCFALMIAVLAGDRLIAGILSVVMIILMAAGRFTFDVLGGAPEISGWNIYEMRCVGELLMLVLVCCLCMIHDLSGDPDGCFLRRSLAPFLTDDFDAPGFSLRGIRIFQILLCITALVLMVFGGFRGGLDMINTLISIPMMIGIAGDRNNKNLILVPVLLKLVTDLREISFLNSREWFVVFIAVDLAAVLLVLFGKRKVFSAVMIVQIILITADMLLYSCCTVDRRSMFYFKDISMFGAELMLYTCFLLFAFGRRWSRTSVIYIFRCLLSLEDHPDDDRIVVWAGNDTTQLF